MDKGKVLIVEQQNGSPSSISKVLEEEGYNVISVEDSDNVYDLTVNEKPEIVMLDLDSLEQEGWEVCRKLKDDYEARRSVVIMVSSKEDEESIVRGFESGADDFITRPFGRKEFTARIRAIIRRIEKNESKKIKVKDIEIDLDEHKVKKGGKPIDLTYIQFKLLYLLASRRENVFSRKEILEKVWGRKVYVTNRTVDVHIKRLREKLGEYKYPSQYIETIHGTGYRFL
ncbi:response regulator transcription factor [candidate division KSB1 bacterium]|nr:response regulator transcription factor [candidate division KSB1 bacterium]